MDKHDINSIINIIDNISDSQVLSTTLRDVENNNRNILTSFGVDDAKCDKLLLKLYGYKLVETTDDLEYGLFTRIIKLTNIETIDDIKVQNIGIPVKHFNAYSKKHNRHRILICSKLGRVFNNIVFEECLVFQKIRNDDQLVMSLIDYLRD